MNRKTVFLIVLMAQTAAAEPLDVTIKGATREKVTIERVMPSPLSAQHTFQRAARHRRAGTQRKRSARTTGGAP